MAGVGRGHRAVAPEFGEFSYCSVMLKRSIGTYLRGYTGVGFMSAFSCFV